MGRWGGRAVERWGLAGVFAVCFLSSTLLPGVSEAAIVGMAAGGAFRAAPLLVVASVGNWLGSVFTFASGWLGSEWLMGVLGVSGGDVPDFVSEWVRDYGSLCGLLAWAPGFGDFLALGLGIAKTPVVATCATMLVGKAARYAVLFRATAAIAKTARGLWRRKREKKTS